MTTSQTDALQIAIVGAGLMGRWHSQAATRIGGRLSAIIDTDQEAARSLSHRYLSAQFFPSLTDCLAVTPPNVVHICTPLSSHSNLIAEALRAGCHVLTEKPLTDTLAKTKDLLALAKTSGVHLNPVHQFPFQTGFQKVLDQRSRLGSLVRVTYQTCSAGGVGRSPQDCRSILLEILPHPISLLYALFQDDLDPTAWQIVRATDDDLELSGQVGTTQLSIVLSLRGRPTCNQMQIVGTEATAHVDFYHGYSLFEAGPASRTFKVLKPLYFGTQLLGQAGSNLIKRAAQQEPAYPGLRQLIREFYGAIAIPGPAPISANEMLAAALLYEQLKQP